jgi:predicted permease
MPGVNAAGLVELVVIPLGPLRAQVGSWAKEEWSYPDFSEMRHADTGMAITGWVPGESESRIQRPDGAGSLRVPTMFVSANYFRTVGVSLVRGPGFDSAVDDAPSAEPAVILGYDFWQNTLGSDPDIVGKTLTLDGVPRIVAGIAPDGFRGHLDSDTLPSPQLFVPLGQHPRLRAAAERKRDSAQPQESERKRDSAQPQATERKRDSAQPQANNVRFNRDIDWVRILGRLSPGVGRARANAAVVALMSGLAEQYPASNEFKAASVEEYYVRGARTHPQNLRVRAWVLGLSAMVLLVVCLNISGMMLVRGAMRERELSIREALGAGRRRLIQYLLSEAVMLAGLGGALSALVLFGVPALVAWGFGKPLPPQFTPDGVVIAICVGACLAASMVFGLLPAIRFSRPNLISALKDDSGGGGRKVGRVHRLAVAVQVGFAVPFLVIGGVLLDEARTGATGLGFEPDGLVAARLDPAVAGYRGEKAGFFLRSVRDNLERTNGVASVTMADGLPLDFERRIIRVGRPDRTDFVSVHATRVAEGYLDTIGAPLLRGRSITAEDRAGAALVTVISEPLALRLFPNSDAVGKQLKFASAGSAEQVFTIVGVTGDFATSYLSPPLREQMLLPLTEHPESRVFVIARVEAGNEASLTSTFENVVRDFDKNLATTHIVSGTSLVRRGIEDLIGASAVSGASGGVALALAALGVCGVIGFMAATRRREIAVRIALGASSPRVLGMVLFDVVKLAMPGVAGGLLLAAALIRTQLSNYPFGVVEPVVYIVAAAIVVFVALLAGLPSARRAASVNPMVAMRSE